MLCIKAYTWAHKQHVNALNPLSARSAERAVHAIPPVNKVQTVNENVAHSTVTACCLGRANGKTSKGLETRVMRFRFEGPSRFSTRVAERRQRARSSAAFCNTRLDLAAQPIHCMNPVPSSTYIIHVLEAVSPRATLYVCFRQMPTQSYHFEHRQPRPTAHRWHQTNRWIRLPT